MDASLWVHQNVMKLSKQFGINFQGCEKDALALFMKIDICRQFKRQEENTIPMETPKRKGNNELKSLVIDMKFKSIGARNRGKEIPIVDQ